MKSTDSSVAQFCAGFAPGDAITSEAINIDRLLRQWGHRAAIYAWPEYIHAQLRNHCKPISDFDASGTDLLIYHHSIGSPMASLAIRFHGPKIMIYHNITPGDYFVPYNREIARQLAEGREQLSQASDAFDLALADSEFNRRELESLGYRNTGVLPYLFCPPQVASITRQRIRLPKRDATTILFVGRMAPNKKAEDLLKIFSLYQRFYNSHSRLVWVGSWGGVDLYYTEVQAIITKNKIRNVIFAGHAPQDVLNAWFQQADVFVCVSEHEGFCVPILESFSFGVPVVAYAATAVAETVGKAGLLFTEKDPAVFSEAIHRVIRDKELRGCLVARGKARLENDFSYVHVSNLLREYLSPFL